MTELPIPGERTKQVIELAEKVARQPLPLRTRILLPALLLLAGLVSFWFGFRDDDPAGPIRPTEPTIDQATTVPVVATSVVFTSPP